MEKEAGVLVQIFKIETVFALKKTRVVTIA
jgi:hypothetical protein